jgi:hypothetical protein
MEILTLRLLLTEQDLQELADQQLQQLPPDQGLPSLQLRIVPEGVVVSGVYPTSLMELPFETLWQPAVLDGKLRVRLARVSTGSGVSDFALDVFNLISPGAVRGTVMNQIAGFLKGDDTFRIEGDTIVADPEQLLARQGFRVRVNLTAVHCLPGQLVLESAPPGDATPWP